MKIAIVAADGRAARKIAAEAVSRGMDVTCFGRRDTNTTPADKYVKRDIFDLTKEDLSGFDAVVDAFGAWTPETLDQHSSTLKHLCDLLAGTQTRLLVVGGAGSLYLNKEHTMTLSDSPEFPDSYKPLAGAMAKALAELRKRDDVLWTYISPAGDFRADGERTGKYIQGGEELTLNSRGESVISYADYAVCMIVMKQMLMVKNSLTFNLHGLYLFR